MQGSGFRVQGAGCRVQGSGCRVQGSRFRVPELLILSKTSVNPEDEWSQVLYETTFNVKLDGNDVYYNS